MADFVTFVEAERAAEARVLAGTYIAAYPVNKDTGAPGIRCLMPMNASGSAFDGQTKAGAWEEVVA